MFAGVIGEGSRLVRCSLRCCVVRPGASLMGVGLETLALELAVRYMCMIVALRGCCAESVRAWLCRTACASMHMAVQILGWYTGNRSCRNIFDVTLFPAVMEYLYNAGWYMDEERRLAGVSLRMTGWYMVAKGFVWCRLNSHMRSRIV